MKSKKQILSAILAALMVASSVLLTSCGGDTPTPPETSSGTSTTPGSSSSSSTGTTAPVTVPEGAVTSSSKGGDVIIVETSVAAGETTAASLETVVDRVQAGEVKPLPEKNYNGEKVNILMRTEWAYEFTEGSGDASVDEAVYNMVADVEDEFNLRFNFIDIPGNWNSRTSFVNAVHNSVLAEDQAYDLVFGYQAYMIDNIANGDYMNMLDLPYLQMGQKWWTQEGVDSLTLNGRCYMATGDLFLSMWRSLYCTYFNKDIAAEYGLNDIYSLVKSGDWTHDKMAEYTMMVSDDLNGDDIYDENDKYGLVGGDSPLREFIVAYNTPIVAINGSEISMAWNTERSVKVVEDLVTLFKTNSAYNTSQTTYRNMFKDGHVLFMLNALDTAATLRATDIDFGIIPYPMMNKDQGAYFTSTGNNSSMACVPVTVRDEDMSALVLEALARKGDEYVQPAFYETALRGKMTRDQESQDMIDIIRNGLRFDFGWVHSVALNLGGSYQTFVDELNTDFASYYASRIDEYNENIKTIRAMYFE